MYLAIIQNTYYEKKTPLIYKTSAFILNISVVLFCPEWQRWKSKMTFGKCQQKIVMFSAKHNEEEKKTRKHGKKFAKKTTNS